jgi:hypothetical protein
MKEDNENLEWLIITDLEQFIEAARVLVFQSFGKSDQDDISQIMGDLTVMEAKELDEILSTKECQKIADNYIRKQKNKNTKKIRLMTNEILFMQMVEAFNSRMVSNILHNLVNKGVLDTAYDEKSNDFIFWIKEDENNTEASETD